MIGCLICFRTVCCLQGSLFRLQEVRVLGKPGVSQLLELAGQATICYVVKDEASDNAKHIASAPLLQLEGRGISDDASDTSIAAKAGAAADFKRRGLAGTGASSGATLQPEAERGIARRLAGMCREVLAASGCPGSACAFNPSALTGSSSSGSEQHHDAPCSSAGAEDGLSSHQATAGEHNSGSIDYSRLPSGRRQLHMPASAGTAAPGSWLKETHAKMAEQYCLQRALLLARVAANLECQALQAS